jgi:tetratricopeptide (TPR) repeat protein
LVRARDIKPDDPDVYGQMARYYEARGDFDQMITALNMRAQKDPASPEAKYHIAVKYWEKVCLPERKECAAFAAERRMKPQYIVDGLAAAESALDIRTDYIDALVYKGLLLRSQAYLEPQRADALVKEADEIIEQVKEIQQRQKGEASAETSGTSAGA